MELLKEELAKVRERERELIKAIRSLEHPRCSPKEYIGMWLTEAINNEFVPVGVFTRLQEWCVSNIDVEQLVVYRGSYCYEGTKYITFQTGWMKGKKIEYETSEQGGTWLDHNDNESYSSIEEIAGGYVTLEEMMKKEVWEKEEILRTIHCEALRGGWTIENEGYIVETPHQCVDW